VWGVVARGEFLPYFSVSKGLFRSAEARLEESQTLILEFWGTGESGVTQDTIQCCGCNEWEETNERPGMGVIDDNDGTS